MTDNVVAPLAARVQAITEGDTQSHIDITICIECGTCERNCPSSAIIFVSDEEYERLYALKEK